MQHAPAIRTTFSAPTASASVPPSRLPPHGCGASFRSLQPDVSAALTYVLPTLAAKLLAGTRDSIVLGLRDAALDGIAIDGLVLERFNLTGVKLRDASLNGADFRGARLSFANFDRACLRRADFSRADLTGSRFAGASLRGAHFRDARLRGATFTRAALAEAHLSPAQRREVVVSG